MALTDRDGWRWTVELADMSTDPDLGAEPSPPGETYVDVEVAVTNGLDDRRADLPGLVEVFAFIDDADRSAVDECLSPVAEPFGGDDEIDGCLVAWDGYWGYPPSQQMTQIRLSFGARVPGDLPTALAGGERVRFSLRGLTAVDEAIADDVTVALAWPAGDAMSAEVAGDAAIQRGETDEWVVLSAP